MLNALPLEEIHRRFFETLSQYGISPEELREILNKMPRYATEGELNPGKNQMGLMNYVLFFSRHCFRPEEFRSDKEKLIADYKEAIKKGEVALTFKADYLILSKVDQKWVKKGSFIERLISRKSPLFDNGFYQVYPIK